MIRSVLCLCSRALLQGDEGGRRAPHPHGLLHQPILRGHLRDGSSQRVALRGGSFTLCLISHFCGVSGRLPIPPVHSDPSCDPKSADLSVHMVVQI